MTTGGRVFGLQSEELAADFLKSRGYRVVERNYRTRQGELDLIAYDGAVLVFVEVKARRGNVFGEPHWSVDRRKQEKLCRLAQHYLYRHRLKDQACRFDLVLIQAGPGDRPVVELLRNAFESKEGFL